MQPPAHRVAASSAYGIGYPQVFAPRTTGVVSPGPSPGPNPSPNPDPNQIVAPHATGVARAKELFDALTTLFDEAESKELRRAAAEAGDEEVTVWPHTRLALIRTLTLT